MTLAEMRVRTRQKISANLSASTYTDPQVDADLNEAYQEVLTWVFQACGIWEARGEMSTHDLELNQAETLLPTDLVFLNRVEVKYFNAVKFVKAKRIDDKQIDHEAFQNKYIGYMDKNNPVYRVFDDSLFIYPLEDTATSVNGLAIEYGRMITALLSGTDVPVLNPILHRVLPSLAALQYADRNDMRQKYQRLSTQIYGVSYREDDPNSLKHQVQEVVRTRDRSVKTRFIPRYRSYK